MADCNVDDQGAANTNTNNANSNSNGNNHNVARRSRSRDVHPIRKKKEKKKKKKVNKKKGTKLAKKVVDGVKIDDMECIVCRELPVLESHVVYLDVIELLQCVH